MAIVHKGASVEAAWGIVGDETGLKKAKIAIIMRLWIQKLEAIMPTPFEGAFTWTFSSPSSHRGHASFGIALNQGLWPPAIFRWRNNVPPSRTRRADFGARPLMPQIPARPRLASKDRQQERHSICWPNPTVRTGIVILPFSPNDCGVIG